MQDVHTIKNLIGLWPSRAVFLEDLRDLREQFPDLKVSIHQVNKWAEKGSIPPRYHFPIVVAAQGREFPVSAELIARLHAPESDVA